MRRESALSRLKDGELCIVTTQDGEREMRWSVTGWCFFYFNRGTPVICNADEIEEWRPVSINYSSVGWPSWCRDKIIRTESNLGIRGTDMQAVIRRMLERIEEVHNARDDSFLDFDVVLPPFPPGRKAFFCHLDRFEACLRAYPGLKVVVSSSWRETFSWDEICSFFASDLQDRIIDKTPVLPGGRRYGEVQAWLRTQDCRQPWIALDDAIDEFPDECPQLCRCYTTIGFDENAKRRLVAMIEDLLRLDFEAARRGKPGV